MLNDFRIEEWNSLDDLNNLRKTRNLQWGDWNSFNEFRNITFERNWNEFGFIRIKIKLINLAKIRKNLRLIEINEKEKRISEIVLWKLSKGIINLIFIFSWNKNLVASNY